MEKDIAKSTTHYYSQCNKFIKINSSRKLNRIVFGKLLGGTWIKAATMQNAVSTFKATGIVPLNQDKIPKYTFLIDVDDNVQQLDSNIVNRTNSQHCLSNNSHKTFHKHDNRRSETSQIQNSQIIMSYKLNNYYNINLLKFRKDV